MRQDIQKVVCERQRGGSSERSLKTALKVNPKFFTPSRRKMAFEEFRLHLLELCDGWEDPNIINGVDYTSDFGPTFVSSARHRQEGRCSGLGGKKKIDHKRRNENTKPIYRFLHKNVGRPWDDVYSEICENQDRRSTQGFHFLEHIGWAVAQDVIMIGGKPYQTRWGRRENFLDFPYTGYYVNPDTGILCEGERRTYGGHAPAPVESIHWYGDTWFKLEVFKDVNLDCRCRSFKVPPLPEDKDKKGYYRRYDDRPAVCIHGNEPTPRPIWYVVTYAWHQPNEVYKVIHGYDWEAKRIGLKSNETKTIYYRDVPDILAKPITFRKKVANKKELAFIHNYIASGGVHKPSPEPASRCYPYY